MKRFWYFLTLLVLAFVIYESCSILSRFESVLSIVDGLYFTFTIVIGWVVILIYLYKLIFEKDGPELSDKEKFEESIERNEYRLLPDAEIELINHDDGKNQWLEIKVRQEAESYRRDYPTVLPVESWEKVGKDVSFLKAADEVIIAKIRGLGKYVCYIPKEA
jgi:hypothetical protein